MINYICDGMEVNVFWKFFFAMINGVGIVNGEFLKAIRIPRSPDFGQSTISYGGLKDGLMRIGLCVSV